MTVSGKDMLNLTLIDLPGLIQTTTEKINQQMIDDVNEIVQRYMAKTRTIILAVIPCNQDIATTEVLKYASEHDPYGHRTLGYNNSIVLSAIASPMPFIALSSLRVVGTASNASSEYAAS